MAKYSNSVVTYSNDVSKEKYIRVVWARHDDERCEEYVLRLKVEFGRKPAHNEGQYEEVRCRRLVNHKGACLNNKPYPG